MKFENTQVFNFEGALRGMRNPMNSWDKSDSQWERVIIFNDGITSDGKPIENVDEIQFVVGDKDLALAQKLIRAGSEHRKFMRQIFVCVDITAPDYWFKEFDTYRIGVTENSTSTMHKIMSKPFSPDMFECSGMRGYKKDVIQTPNEIDEDSELWKQHPIYSDYEISNQGRVKHLTYIDSNGTIRKERILVGSLHNDGYVFISICLGNQKYKQIPKHRLVAETWLDNLYDYPEVNHKDGNKQNNSVDNLEWTTSSNNQQHAVNNHLQPTTITTYKGKLSKQDRETIIRRYNEEDISRRELAKEYQVSHTTISAIINNKYNYGENIHNEYNDFLTLLDELNELRDEYLLTKDKNVWKTLIQKLPMNYLYTRTVTLNYENLLAMCSKGQRRFHKLNEWSGIDNPELPNFISWARTLPYAQELIFIDECAT